VDEDEDRQPQAGNAREYLFPDRRTKKAGQHIFPIAHGATNSSSRPKRQLKVLEFYFERSAKCAKALQKKGEVAFPMNQGSRGFRKK
jgi:hypothetical protein